MSWLSIAVPLVAQSIGFANSKADGLLHPYLDTLAKPAVWTRGAGRNYGISASSSAIMMTEAR
ncbi:MAG: hypothetical protein Q7T25_11725 [Sideroxyarcus sp.]|nr:hypothetical protein [Sideroxyarcus sp.]